MPVLLGSDSETESRPRRVLVNLMIRPSDDHLEPWSLLYNAGGPKVGGRCRHWLPGAYDVGELGPGSELSAGRSCSLRLQPAAMVTRAAAAWVSMYSRRPAAARLRRLRSHRQGWGRQCSEAGGGGRIAGGVYIPLIWAVRRLPCTHHHTPSHPWPISI